MKVLAGLIACAALAGCGSPRLASAPSEGPTIVSLNPCADAILAEVAAPGQLLAISHYSHAPAATSMDLAKARTLLATGGTVEEVLALDPDVVVGSTFMDPATVKAFERLGMQVETLGIASTVADSKAQVQQLAAVAGEPERGEALIGRIDAALAATAHDGTSVSTVLWQDGGIVPGEGTLVAELMEHTGLASHSAARGMRQADYLSLERLLSDPPELLLVAGNERAQSHPALAQLGDMRTEPFASNLLYCGGPSIIRAVERLAQVRAAHHPQTPSSEEEGASARRANHPLLFRGGGRGVVELRQ
ncbi:ABC transporter substrate-binding protein [Erythrobacter sp. SDW2]|uniref:ABC transporter substrate-binding protein n=1 Tax=Erythrobacter sp. SDW2 TaxID=2907154 RepID=UPI001F2CF6E9|nr:ABC transporter substrate-binding protein [Erythrobacter sp. SDW2]UIP08110.1 ABC transporter substrate-binding protein [Erythrobacter sp. SDW2]